MNAQAKQAIWRFEDKTGKYAKSLKNSQRRNKKYKYSSRPWAGMLGREYWTVYHEYIEERYSEDVRKGVLGQELRASKDEIETNLTRPLKKRHYPIDLKYLDLERKGRIVDLLGKRLR